MRKICEFIFSLSMIYLINAQNQNEEEEENLNENSNIHEIINIEQFEDYLFYYSNKILVIEIYNKDCNHCKEFFPKYRNLSFMFKSLENFIFVKIEGEIYHIIVEKYNAIKVKGVPSLFIYDAKKFIKYNGFMEVENIFSFLFEKYEFDCKEINEGEYFNNFIDDYIRYSELRKNNYILGIFYRNELNEDNIINKFKLLNFRNKDIIKSNTCFYFFYDNNQYKSKYRIQDFLFEHSKNSIIIYNYQKGINNFKLIDFEKFNENLTDNYSINIDKLYTDFLLKNYLPRTENIQSYQINNLYNLPQKSFIFSFKTKDEVKYFQSLIKEIITYPIYNNDYIFILLDISKKINLKRSLSFILNSGLYFFEPGFQNERIVIERNKTIDLENNFKVEDVLNYIDLEKKGKLPLTKIEEEEKKFVDMLNQLSKEFEEKISSLKNLTINKNKTLNNSNQINYNNNETNFEKKTNITKTQKFLRQNNIQNEEILNKTIILFPFYFIIYSILFFWIYKKYITNIEINFFKEIKEVKAT